MPKVKVRQNDNIDKALRKLRSKCEKAGTLKSIKEHEFYIKPSDKRRAKTNKPKKKTNPHLNRRRKLY